LENKNIAKITLETVSLSILISYNNYR